MIRALLSRLAPPAAPGRATLRDWAELLRVSALFTVPGDALAGAAAAGLRPNRGTALAVGASLCLYEAGMALNDWADRDEDAVDRPHRPIPSGRITPGAALTAAGGLTAAGLALASRAGRPALAVATALSATVWAYDLHLKHTPAAPAAMAAARGLDLLLGATATLSASPAPGTRPAAPPAPAIAGTPSPVARVPGESPRGVRRGAAAVPPAPAIAATTPPGARVPGAPPRAVRRGAAAGGWGAEPPGSRQGFGEGRGGGLFTPTGGARAAAALAAHTYAVTAVSRHEAHGGSTATPLVALAATTALASAVATPPAGPAPLLLTAAYLRTAATGYLHAALNPSPALTQRAVGGGIRAMIPLQAALAARSGAPVTGLAVMGLVPIARTLARKVSPT
ncbi:UbiA family prenyltransferase [Streptomyces sp. NPDC015127]|uniref:UbiA family prenyltransferase n=1 Tax=Streptomyces sp. NPDC015127 TaxID=3364939 RepID=UPI0036F93E72